MKDVQGYLAIVPNSPDGRGILHFSIESAKRQKIEFDTMVAEKWDDGKTFNMDHWKEKPLPMKIYTLTVKEEITE